MRGWGIGPLFLMLAASCSRPPAPSRAAIPAEEPVRITQFYTAQPKLARGEKALLCYGVANAKAVWLSPPRQELTASATRCVEVNPAATTTYTLTAEGSGGKQATQDLTVTVGAPRVKIVEVKVSTLDLHLGDQLSFCYQVENAKSVEVEPAHFRGGARPHACFMASPRETTTYVVTARGSDGDTDQERVTVKVR